ncbi:hypothetical protein J6590_073978 [Homalodisca vitripennis]|nr:hypothetical protein J6590_073978 [Homalodisca vitripennis]
MDRSKRYIFLGYANIDLLTCNDDVTNRYLNCLNGYGLVQCVDKPTRVTEHSMTCIDHIFVSYDDMSRVRAVVLQTTVTDHYSTGLNITLNTANCCYKLESKDPRLSFFQTGDQPDLDPPHPPALVIPRSCVLSDNSRFAASSCFQSFLTCAIRNAAVSMRLPVNTMLVFIIITTEAELPQNLGGDDSSAETAAIL